MSEIVEPPEDLSFNFYDDERVDLAVDLGIIGHRSEQVRLGDTVDPPSDTELLEYLNKKYAWGLYEVGKGENLTVYADDLMSLQEMFNEATALLHESLEPEAYWIYRVMHDKEGTPVGSVYAVKLPTWIADHQA